MALSLDAANRHSVERITVGRNLMPLVALWLQKCLPYSIASVCLNGEDELMLATSWEADYFQK
jgi:hypothetical protein